MIINNKLLHTFPDLIVLLGTTAAYKRNRINKSTDSPYLFFSFKSDKF